MLLTFGTRSEVLKEHSFETANIKKIIFGVPVDTGDYGGNVVKHVVLRESDFILLLAEDNRVYDVAIESTHLPALNIKYIRELAKKYVRRAWDAKTTKEDLISYITMK